MPLGLQCDGVSYGSQERAQYAALERELDRVVQVEGLKLLESLNGNLRQLNHRSDELYERLSTEMDRMLEGLIELQELDEQSQADQEDSEAFSRSPDEFIRRLDKRNVSLKSGAAPPLRGSPQVGRPTASMPTLASQPQDQLMGTV